MGKLTVFDYVLGCTEIVKDTVRSFNAEKL